MTSQESNDGPHPDVTSFSNPRQTRTAGSYSAGRDQHQQPSRALNSNLSTLPSAGERSVTSVDVDLTEHGSPQATLISLQNLQASSRSIASLPGSMAETVQSPPNTLTSGRIEEMLEERDLSNSATLAQHEMSSPTLNPLPADDGMRSLRVELHRIREMALSSEEKAQRMHELMVADYQRLKSQQGNLTEEHSQDFEEIQNGLQHSSTPPSPASISSTFSENAFSLEPSDLEPTHYPHFYDPEVQMGEAENDSDDEENGPPLGCKHYMRNVKVQCSDCGRWYTCRHCHDEKENHRLIRKHIRHMLCMLCGQPQRASGYCRQCEEQTACYYCDICKLWDNDASKTIYHCPDCGICRRGEGLGKDYEHCAKCNVCVSIQYAQDHRCVERATDCDCPICGEYMFTSSFAVVAMKCGHYIHRICYDELMNITYKCPICSRSAVNMELQWRKMDDCIMSQPMPDQYANTQAWIVCNDCTMRSYVPFHWLGNKCRMCDSYNTNQLKLLNEPKERVLESADIEAQQQEAARAAGLVHSNGGSLTGLRSMRQTQANSLENGTAFPQVSSPQPAIAQSVDAEEDAQVPQHAPIHMHNNLASSTRTDTSPPPLDLNDVPPALRQHRRSDSSASFPISNLSEVEEETRFWGEGINPGDYMPSLPQMPTMPNIPRMPSLSMPSIPNGWRSPRLFAREDNEQEPDQSETVPSWRFHPSQWRLSSPTGFWRTESARDDGVLLDEDLALSSESSAEKGNSSTTWFGWDPRQWRLPTSPRLFGESDDVTDDTVSAHGTSPDSGSAWPMDPRQWRFNNSQIFGRSRSVDAAVPQTVNGEDNTGATSPSRLWNMRPRSFLAQRLGSFSIPGASETQRSDDDYSAIGRDEGSEEASEDEGSIKSCEVEEDKDDEGEEDEMDLIGHR